MSDATKLGRRRGDRPRGVGYGLAMILGIPVGAAAAIVLSEVIRDRMNERPPRSRVHRMAGRFVGEWAVGYVQSLDHYLYGQWRYDLAEARDLALTDALTSLPGRRTIESHMRAMVARTQDSLAPVAFAIIDVDHFKAVNESFGHPAGDRVLQELGAVLERFMEQDPWVAIGRFDGEEFAVILWGLSGGQAVDYVERIRTAVEAHDFSRTGVPEGVTVSIGVASAFGAGATKTDIYERADTALREAKSAGRNRVVLSSVGEPVKVANGARR